MQPGGTILAYLVEGHPQKISVKLFENWPAGLGIDIILRFFIFSSGCHLVYGSGTILPILLGSQLGIIPVKSNWPRGIGGVGVLIFFYF